MKAWKLGPDGYVLQFMVAGPAARPFSRQLSAGDQLEQEARLRQAVVRPQPLRQSAVVRLNRNAPNGCPWRLWVSSQDIFVDLSAFYSTPQTVALDMATSLIMPQAGRLLVRLYSYMAVSLYVNGKLAGSIDRPVYKPIHHVDLELNLNRGPNLLLFICQNLGVRDTRNLLALKVLGDGEPLRVALPDLSIQDQVWSDLALLDQIELSGDTLIFPEAAEQLRQQSMLHVLCPYPSPDYEQRSQLPEILTPGPQLRLSIPEIFPRAMVEISRHNYALRRTLEISSHIQPVRLPQEDGPLHGDLARIAAVASLDREEFGFSVMNILARRLLGQSDPQDQERMLEDFRLIEQRVDCADFLICGYIRYQRLFTLPPTAAARLRQVLLDFRYWMDQPGSDGMCFWSENHALMFYSCALFAGERYPDDYFSRAGLRGRELAQAARAKVEDWLRDCLTCGFEEFLSSVYMCVTLAALLNLVDFADQNLADMAETLCDRMLRQLAWQTFDGSVIAPMGRVYRDALYPFSSGSQSILHVIDPTLPYAYGEGWLVYLASSRYQLPAELAKQMATPADLSYNSGNAQIRLRKTRNYCLTSVQIPKTPPERVWNPDRQAIARDPAGPAATKAMNERFHGTSCFQPGGFGYQQQLWYAALSAEALIFVNHPGTTSELSDMRPGYWFGNGQLPAIRQTACLLGAIYQIDSSYPVQFTHVYAPLARFDQVRQQPHWLFFQKKQGYLALWCSGDLLPEQNLLYDCEFRVWGANQAYLVYVSDQEHYPGLPAFIQSCLALAPQYDVTCSRLTAGDFELTYERGHDQTQYIP
ncbi:hypothetical protein HCH52_06050 [Oscillospiraceae bacterium HV4-5-C5C]|nr:hypothetical protein [Oscillospiraceae bacterium HV4-5-C5C]